MDIYKFVWYCSFEVITSGGDSISVEYEKLYFNPDTIDNFNQFANSYKFKIRYFYGYLVKFNKDNVYAISPYLIRIISIYLCYIMITI